jgi:hypothetical protein
MISTEQVNKSKEVKEYHLKKLYLLSLKSIAKCMELNEPTDEQKQWMKKHGF